MTKYDMKSRKKSAAQNLDAYDILKVKLNLYPVLRLWGGYRFLRFDLLPSGFIGKAGS